MVWPRWGVPSLIIITCVLFDESKRIKPGTVYRNTAACTQFIQCIADSIRNDTQKLISNTKFMSVTMDGSTDVSGEEQESFYIRLSLAGRVYQRYLSVATPKTTTAQGIFDLLMIQLKTQGVDLKKLIGFGSDGAATMMGSRSGVAIRLKEICPLLIAVHCLAHRLELCFRYAIKKCNLYDKVQTLLIGIYYLYKRSYKQKKTLKNAFLLRNMKPVLPPRVGGTRWLPHLCHAIEVFFYGYRAILTQLQNNSHESAKGGRAG